MTKFCVVYETWTTTANFSYFHLELNAIVVYVAVARRRRRGRHLVKTNLYLIFECYDSVNLFSAPIGLKTCPGFTCIDGDIKN